MSETGEVTCERHGASKPRTFSCVHIAQGECRGFRVAPTATDPWPDARCDACANDPNAARKLVCKHCWEDAFGRNTLVPPHPDPEEWIQAAQERTEERQEGWIARHGIGTHGHWEMQLEGAAPWLGFGKSAKDIHVRCDALVIGSWSRRGKSWLWGWGNSHWDAHLTSPLVVVKRFGEANGIERLWRMGGQATEEDSFALAAAAIDLVPAVEGMYRVPGEQTSLFLAVLNTQLVS
jgi:hypothetical protein